MSRKSHPGAAIGSAAVYLLLALWQMRHVLRAPTIHAPFSSAFYDIGARFGFHDLQMVVSQIAYNARTLASAPQDVFTGPQCYPMESASTFGEHMLGEGVFGVVPYLLTGDPLATMAAVVTIKPLIAALAAFALVLRWTGHSGAAFVAGLLFGFHPLRLIDPAHPYLSGNEWTMLALLALDGIVAGGGWAWVALLVLAGWFQILESFYPLLGFTFVLGVYGAWLVVARPRALVAVLPKLVVVGAAMVIGAYVILGPYLATRDVWPVLGDRSIFVLYPLTRYFLGSHLFLGVTFWVLALAGGIDLIRGARRTWPHDPRWPLLVGGLLVLWFGVEQELALVGWKVPALYHFLRWVPGVDAVRSPAVVTYAGLVPAALFAGYGVTVILRDRSRAAARWITGALAALWILEVFLPSASTRIFGHRFEASAVPLRPSDDLLALHEQLPPGPVLNLPWARGKSGEYLLLSAYHHRRIGACYNSFEAPIAARLRVLAEAVPDPEAIQALAALGFDSIVVHDDVYARPEIRSRLDAVVDAVSGSEASPVRLAPIGETDGHRAYALHGSEPPAADVEALVRTPAELLEVVGPGAVRLSFGLVNPGPRVYRHPQPIEPSALVVRWQGPSGAVVREEEVRVLLPIVLVAGEAGAVEVEVVLPPAGTYEVSLLRSGSKPGVLAHRTVRVGPHST